MAEIDLEKLSQEITDKYSIENNALVRIVKDDPKDRIQVEIGDTKQTDFYPQIKIMRWDNEVNFSVRLKDTEYDKATVTTEGDKIIWSKGNVDIEYYDYIEGEGGHKMVWSLKEKPVDELSSGTTLNALLTGSAPIPFLIPNPSKEFNNRFSLAIKP